MGQFRRHVVTGAPVLSPFPRKSTVQNIIFFFWYLLLLLLSPPAARCKCSMIAAITSIPRELHLLSGRSATALARSRLLGKLILAHFFLSIASIAVEKCR